MSDFHDLRKGLEAELESAFGNLDMEELLGQPSAPQVRPVDLQPGDRVTGRIARVAGEDVIVDLGPRTQGVCSRIQFTDEPPVGEDREFMVQRYSEGENLYYLNPVGAVQKADWEHLQVGQVVEARCTGTNKGGLEMEVAGHRAFMPAAQIDLWRVEDLEQFVGQTLACEVIEFKRESRNIVLSRRAVLERERDALREKLWETIQPGQTVEGIVRKIMPFGAFVDLGGLDGLIHVSDLSWSRVNKVEDVVSEGQRVKVQVLKVDRDANRIGLGLKQAQGDPFETAANAITEGATVTGRVTKIVDFGAFVEIQPGVEGLIHISELSHERVARVDKVVKPDEIVTAKVLSVDPESRRIALSLKALKEQREEEAERVEDPGLAKLKAKFGGFGKLKGGIE